MAIALVILAVGTLALQALALSAGRSLATAEVNTRAANLVASYAEATLAKLALDSLPQDLECELPGGDRLSRTTTEAVNGQGVRFVITLAPVGGPESIRSVTGYAFSPHGYTRIGSSDECP